MGSREKQSSDKMRSLLVLTVASLASAAPQFYGLPLTYSSPLTYTYTPQVTKLVAKNIEVPVEVAKFSVKETGCVNSFGLNVPCAQEGEARRKRSADEERLRPPPPPPSSPTDSPTPLVSPTPESAMLASAMLASATPATLSPLSRLPSPR